MVLSNIKANNGSVAEDTHMWESVSISGSFVIYIIDRLDGIGKLAGMPLLFATR